MPYNRGDVVLVTFPNSDMKTYKQRPALIVQSDSLTTNYADRLVACITSNTTKSGESVVPIIKATPEGSLMGVLQDSVIIAHNIACLPSFAIKRKLGSCPPSIQTQVDNALRKTFDI